MKFASELIAVTMAGLAAGAASSTSPLRNIVYFDQYHVTTLPGKNITAGITHVVMAFANSSLFTTEPAGEYEPFMSLDEVRPMFDEGTHLGIAIGGWGDTAGFGLGSASEESRLAYAKNVADMATKHGFDFVDIDWEYPGGNGADYRQIPNANKTGEIAAFPALLKDLKEQLQPLGKQLSIAVPGLERDMMAFTAENNPLIFDAVDMVNVMTYDLLNRRDTVTTHHTSVAGSLEIVRRYKQLGLEPSKINLGLAYYAKFFQTQPGVKCTEPVGCLLVKAENDDGSDAGTSGAMTFETINVFPPATPTNLTVSSDDSCGVGTSFTCSGLEDKGCCSTYGWCGSTAAHCGVGCQSGFGTCEGPDVTNSFTEALANGKLDEEAGGMWYWDEENEVFWTWDSAELIRRKFVDIVAPEQIGGVMAWSLAEDSADWSHILAVQQGIEELSAQMTVTAGRRRRSYRKY
ncbi:family 18 glycosyl hydrolase [Biscogniauxia marginata]|nr:family 18 glycosyl hydrolase [Biscogniauxia marginata]